ncbi:MAG: SurA N-terminal domain-containing protein [Archangium sp.]|nr:SurA N-terminal domain-containing protein [Archangium sp.]
MSNSTQTQRLSSYVFIFALAILFALQWGPGSQGCDRIGKDLPSAEKVATVNGTDIPLKDFARAYGGQLAELRQRGLPPEFAKQFGMHTQVLDMLVNTELLAQAAEARGLAASDEDLRALLLKQPEFQNKDGAFDFERYQDIIRSYEGTTEVAYEAKLRRQISAQRMMQLVESTAVVSDDEVKARYLKEGNSANATFVRFSPVMFASKVPAPKPAEVTAWAAAHEADLKAAYEAQKASFTTPEQAHVRQILLKVSKDDPAEKKAEVKQRIENLRKELVDNKKPFAEIASSFSEDLETRTKGGDLGYVDRYRLPSAFADLVFSLSPGDVTLPVETPVGYLLGTIEDKKPAEVKPFDAVRTELATQLVTKEKAKTLAQTAAQKALADAKAGKKLVDLFPAAKDAKDSQLAFAAESSAPEAKETGEFNSSTDSIPQLGAAPDVHKAVFARTDAGLLDQVFTVGDTFAVVVVDQRKLTSDANFNEQKSQLRLEATKGKQYEVRDAFLKSLKQASTVTTYQQALDRVIDQG